MPHTPRIGIQIGPGDPFWVQVREVISQRAQSLPVDLVEIVTQERPELSRDEQDEIVEDLIVQELDALIGNAYAPSLVARVLDRNIPIIYVSEIAIRHPRFSSRVGLYQAGYMLGTFLHEQLAGHGTILIVGGLGGGEDNGQSRLDGFHAALAKRQYTIYHLPSSWTYEESCPQIAAFLRAHPDLQFDAIFGLSDSLALAARDICRELGRARPGTLIIGVNGDPLALAAIADGSMVATVETDVEDIAAQALDLAYRAARGAPLPPYFSNQQRLVTSDNVAQVAMNKLISLANLPSHLVGVNRRNEQQRVIQLETSLAIDRQVGLILDAQQLSQTITALIRDNYGFDHAQCLIWDESTGQLAEVGGTTIPIDSSGPLAHALIHNQSVFIPDTYASHRFAPDPAWPATHARVVVPVRLGGQVVGLLDLHRHQATHHTREELNGLQLLADQLGISMRNAELYGQALQARAVAEKADRLKTVLLTNVSHELRTPLNAILGYSRTALDTLAGRDTPLEDAIVQDLSQIYRSSEHLQRLINDLLDLSRAEINELDLLPDMIDTRSFLEEVFQDCTNNFGTGAAVAWQLELPETLPPIVADPVRLRQVLLNLLHNASKFTKYGQIILGAALDQSDLHLWVTDTGCGIPPELQAQIFEPFMRVDRGMRHEGIGLGLSIARRLLELHHGRMLVESQPGQGSTFHLYLPQPIRELLLISAAMPPPASLLALAERRGLNLRQLPPGNDLVPLLTTTRPALLVWDLTTATAGWSAVEQIHAQLQFGQLPVMLYQGGQPGAPDTPHGPTGLLLKPPQEAALIEALNSLDPGTPEGNILIIEDDPQTSALHCRVIGEHFPNYAIHEADNGRVALELLAQLTPSLVVLDLVMPEIDGFAVLEALRTNPRTATVPVLVLSGRSLSADDIRRLSQARVIFQTKELLSDTELAEALRRTLAHDAPLPPHTSVLVKRALALIQLHYSEPLSRQQIADAVGVSKDYLGRIFHQELGLSPWEYLIRYRILRAKELLRTTDYSIGEVAARTGFDTATYFSRIFHREVGCSPRAFRTQVSRFPTPCGRDS